MDYDDREAFDTDMHESASPPFSLLLIVRYSNERKMLANCQNKMAF